MALTNEEILEAIASKSVLEISELIKMMEDKFGVSAAAPVAVAAAAGAARQPDPRRAGVFPARAAVPVAGRYQNAARAAVFPALHPDSRRVLRAERLLLRRWPPRSARTRRVA